MTPEQFIAKWKASSLTERAASQSHFNDLCELLGVEKPTDADHAGDWYCFERGASKTSGGEGWADVWKKGHFGWEYKGKRKNLTAAYAQLQQYAVALENPPLLVVSDMDRIVVHTNWTNTVSETHVINIDDLHDANKLDLIRNVFLDPDRLKPTKTTDALTEEVADKFAGLAIKLRERGHDPILVAHFLNRLVFCMFAEDIGLLPRSIFSQIVEKSFHNPSLSQGLLTQLFAAMAKGGLFGIDEIEWFNGGLFDGGEGLPLSRADLKIVASAADLDWSDIDPSIFGTLFERGLDPEKRGQLGAHYTDPAKIMLIIEPVIIEPLLSEWRATKDHISKPKLSNKKKSELLNQYLERLRNFRVLDPACGSGNFLYLALLALKDLEHRVGLEAEALGLGRQFPTVGPEAVQGIEINPYAAELARVTVWIGEIQWMRRNGYDVGRQPILRPLRNIQHRDALINQDGSEAEWPSTDVIIGNPPFLGSRKMGPELTAKYTASIRRLYRDSVHPGSDLVCFWFGKAWQALQNGRAGAVGLIATNSISGGSSRKVLEPIADAEAMFSVWRDQPWVVDGANVDVSVICFSGKKNVCASLNGASVSRIFADLYGPSSEGALDITSAKPLRENDGVAFQGVVIRGSVTKRVAEKLRLPPAGFVLTGARARIILSKTGNPNGKENSDVVVPILNGQDITKRSGDRFVVDFRSMSEKEASLYEEPFRYILPVKAHRALMGQQEALDTWWQHWRTRTEMRAKLEKLDRFIVTPCLSKHRIFTWKHKPTLPDHQVIVFAKECDAFFGILQSKHHRLWSLRKGTTLQNRPRYTPTTCFATFPFPEGLTPDIASDSYASDQRAINIATAAKALDQLRESWLNPETLIKRVDDVVPGLPQRIDPKNEKAARELRKRTLTNLYNLMPSWLETAHQDLDDAVSAAYGWGVELSDDEILQKLVEQNSHRKVGAFVAEESIEDVDVDVDVDGDGEG